MKKSLFISLVLLTLSINNSAYAQLDGARTYWPMPKNFNILSVHKVDARLNASFNNLSRFDPEVLVDNDLHLLTYTRSQPVFERTFYSTLIAPAGDIVAHVDGPLGASETFYQHGLGDITWSNTINLIGSPGLMIKDYVRHEMNTVVHLQLAATLPTGKYDEDSPMSIGSNQYKLKLGFPMMSRIGPWIDGKKMALEIFPSYTFISDNDDYQGQTIKQDGVFAVESHLSRDIIKDAFISLDYSYIDSGDSDFVNNATGTLVKTQKAKATHLAGATVKFGINKHLSIFMTHVQTVGSSGNDTVNLEGSVTKVTLSWAWHDFQEKFNNYLDSE